jgi:hypothetical protein
MGGVISIGGAPAVVPEIVDIRLVFDCLFIKKQAVKNQY